MSAESDSITRWLDCLKQGDIAAAEPLWKDYFPRLVGLARSALKGHRAGGMDEEDIALSAFHSFWARATKGNFPQLEDREDLWRLLATITLRKAFRAAQKEGRFAHASGQAMLEQIVCTEPSPREARSFVEEFHRLLSLLPDDTCRRIVGLRLEGYKNREIAAKVACSVAKVERKLKLTRETWSADGRIPLREIPERAGRPPE